MNYITEHNWPTCWTPIHRTEQKITFEQELYREIHVDHVLHGHQVSLLARYDGTDDCLFLLDDARVAQVHLTWQKEHTGTWPITVIYNNIEEWLASEEDTL